MPDRGDEGARPRGRPAADADLDPDSGHDDTDDEQARAHRDLEWAERLWQP
ncbi:hypothetical protein [Microbacterium oryzae]|uniref:hypothetical protein n=1 Tax=Microbacterium oryzae TaxID=743009 RepID=UPI0012E2629B|nr:hypothetical protein [Microbacterium oryzae]